MGVDGVMMWVREKLFAHTAEEGSRQIIWASVGDVEKLIGLKGKYVSGTEVAEPSDWVLNSDGRQAQEKLWVRVLLRVALWGIY